MYINVPTAWWWRFWNVEQSACKCNKYTCVLCVLIISFCSVFLFFLSCFVYSSSCVCILSSSIGANSLGCLLPWLSRPNASQFNEKSVRALQRGNAGERGEGEVEAVKAIPFSKWERFPVYAVSLPNVYCFVFSLVFHKLVEKQKCLMQLRKKKWFIGLLPNVKVRRMKWKKNFFPDFIRFGCNFFRPNQAMATYKW